MAKETAAAEAEAAPKTKRKAKTVKAKAENGHAKERKRDPAKLDQFGFRKDSLKSRAALMYASKKGATLGEVKDALKSTQFNVLRELEERGLKVERTPVSGEADRKVTRYHVVA